MLSNGIGESPLAIMKTWLGLKILRACSIVRGNASAALYAGIRRHVSDASVRGTEFSGSVVGFFSNETNNRGSHAIILAQIKKMRKPYATLLPPLRNLLDLC